MSFVGRNRRLAVTMGGALCAAVALGASAFYLREQRPRQPTEPFFPGLGTHSRKITTTSDLAQKYFDQGLAFLYGFNYTEAARSFEAAAAADPQCAMAWWGIAIANGDAVTDPSADAPLATAAVEGLQRANRLSEGAAPVEQELIRALSTRYTDPMPDDPRPLDRAYAAAMREVWKKYPRDTDVGALTGQALMLLHRKGQYTKEGEPQPGTDELLNTLNAVLAQDPAHPYALHLMVHVLESSPYPDRADAAANRLRVLAPGLGHLTHMPTHIDIRRGRWEEAVAASEKAIAADTAYRAVAQSPGVYCRLLMAHDNHMLAYAAAMRGESRKATEAIKNLLSDFPAAFVEEHKAKVDGFYAMPYELHLRFGRWDEMLKEPAPDPSMPIATAFWHFARGVSYAAKMNLTEARGESHALGAACRSMPVTAVFRKNPGANVMAVGDKMLAGEILYREGKLDRAFALLREAAQLEDDLLYVEPPEWVQPARHALGATLMDAGRYAEAEAVYQEDLARRPENGYSLLGLAKSLKKQGKLTDASKALARFKAAWRHADFPLTSSCLCLKGID